MAKPQRTGIYACSKADTKWDFEHVKELLETEYSFDFSLHIHSEQSAG